MSTTTAAEVSSNSNSSCRLLDCLNSLPFQDQRAFRNLFSYKELVRLSACCRSLTSSIRNDRALWQALYHRDFLSGVYYAKEMEFVLWCIRTDINNPCTSDKRADLLENVDWYNTYRRRVSTENNWRYGRCKTTHIDMEHDKRGPMYYVRADGDRIFITQRNRLGRASESNRHYTLDYLPHSNLRSSNNTVYKCTFSASPNVLSLKRSNDIKFQFISGDHYIARCNRLFGGNTSFNVKKFSRRPSGIFMTFNVPRPCLVDTVEGKWVLIMHKPQPFYDNISRIYKIMVFDIDNSIMCPGIIDDTWNAAYFYKTTDNTAIVYTVRIVEVDDDDVGRIEWALHQFSSNNPVVQLRSGWFYPPFSYTYSIEHAFSSSSSYVVLRLVSSACRYPFIIHNTELGGQCSTPQNCYTISANSVPIPLLQLGFKRQLLANDSTKVWTDLSYSDDQILQFPGVRSYRHIMGSLYLITNQYSRKPRPLMDINTKEIIRNLKPTAPGETINICTIFGTIRSLDEKRTLVIQEYGEL